VKRFLRCSLSSLVAPSIALVLALFTAGVARADFIVTMTQVGSNVVATGSGEIDLTGLSFFSGGFDTAIMDPSAP
jgi:hypothetical protein